MTNKGKIREWITKWYSCPLCQYLGKTKIEVEQHLALNHTSEEAEEFLKENDN